MIVEVIQACLSPDLLLPEYRGLKGEEPQTLKGHCYVASETLFHLLEAWGIWNFRPRRARDHEGVTHWWLENRNGVILDPTQGQYTDFGLVPPYLSGGYGGFLTKEPSARSKTLLERLNRRFPVRPNALSERSLDVLMRWMILKVVPPDHVDWQRLNTGRGDWKTLTFMMTSPRCLSKYRLLEEFSNSVATKNQVGDFNYQFWLDWQEQFPDRSPLEELANMINFRQTLGFIEKTATDLRGIDLIRWWAHREGNHPDTLWALGQYLGLDTLQPEEKDYLTHVSP